MNTTENNKLIAEFMGVSKSKIDTNGQVLNFENSKYNTYHKDWNWLMEVVEKIESLVSQFNIRTYTLGSTYTDVNIINGDKRIDIELQTSKIEAVYNACVAFIEWYNSADKK